MRTVPSQEAVRKDPSASSRLWRLVPRLDNTFSEAVTVLDGNGTICFQSLPIEWLLGYRPEDLVGACLYDHLLAPSQAAARQALQRMTRHGERFSRWRLCFKSASGSERWLDGKAANFLKDPRLGGIMVYWEALGR